MKNVYKSSSLHVYLQGFVNGTVDTDHTSACDFTSGVCSRVKSGAANTLFNTGFISDGILCN